MRHVNSLAIEGTRVIARILFWTPFLLLPALYQYLRLFFVNFIVVEDPRYDAGQISALERSREMSRGRAGLCFIALLIGTLTEPILSGWINGGEIALWHNPVGALLSLPVSLALNLWTLLFLFSVFEALNQLHPVPASAADPALPTTPPTEAVC